MRQIWLSGAEEALSALATGRGGLSQSEAEERIKRDGKNVLAEGKKRGVGYLFFSQFCDLMTLILIAAAAISGVIAYLSRDIGDLTDTAIIVFIILLNAVVGTIQQYRADRAIEGLKKLSAPTVKVRRGGQILTVASEELAVGDIVVLAEGDVVPADIRVIKANSLFVDESALTGESQPVEKLTGALKGSVPLSARANCLYKSTNVVRGSGEGVVFAVGMATEMGMIAEMIGESKPRKTPLGRTLATLGKVITIAVIAVTALVFALGVFVRGDGVMKNFMTSVALAVAAIPEGLPAVVTIIMALGVQKMSKKKVVIRKLQSVETLGGCSVICTDKTGTLTENRLRVVEVETLCEGKLLECMAACSDVKTADGRFSGDSTEVALVEYAVARGERAERKIDAEIAFSSERKMMTVSCGGELYSKGAPDVLIEKCAYILTKSGVEPLTEGRKKEIISSFDDMSDKALRVLAFAGGKAGEKIEEKDLVFYGLAGLRDEIKEGAAEAVEECRAAKIKTVMITGDSARTAFAIAKELGIASDFSCVACGDELEGLKKGERDELISRCTVFARVSPRHKNIIVKSLQRQGHVVAMTGDGVNDAPSIKSADIGVAMGISGADVTKSASDMVIADDNFATIVAAVREGRRISSNIGKTVRFFLATNLAEVLAILIASIIFPHSAFLLSTQLLWLNLITDSFPVLALGAEREEPDIMRRAPVRAEKSLFGRSSIANILFFGGYITVITVLAFALGLKFWGGVEATTLAFTTISFAELFHAFNVRSDGSAFKSGMKINRVLFATVAAGVALNILLCVSPLAPAFGLINLSLAQWAIAIFLPLSVIPVGELYKIAVKGAKGKRGRVKYAQKRV